MKVTITRRELFEKVNQSISSPNTTLIDIYTSYIREKYHNLEINDTILNKLQNFNKVLRSKYQNQCRSVDRMLKYEFEWLNQYVIDEDFQVSNMEWTSSSPKRSSAGK